MRLRVKCMTLPAQPGPVSRFDLMFGAYVEISLKVHSSGILLASSDANENHVCISLNMQQTAI